MKGTRMRLPQNVKGMAESTVTHSTRVSEMVTSTSTVNSTEISIVRLNRGLLENCISIICRPSGTSRMISSCTVPLIGESADSKKLGSSAGAALLSRSMKISRIKRHK